MENDHTTLTDVTPAGEAAGVWHVLTSLQRLGPTILRACKQGLRWHFINNSFLQSIHKKTRVVNTSTLADHACSWWLDNVAHFRTKKKQKCECWKWFAKNALSEKEINLQSALPGIHGRFYGEWLHKHLHHCKMRTYAFKVH